MGVGLWDNETGQFLEDECLWEGDWFEDGEGCLYIVPLPGVVAETEGLDGEILDEINRRCRDHDQLTDADVEELGLVRIPDVLKRWTPEDGYYHA